MLSQTIEYALRAVVHLASRNPDPQTSDEIAEATRVPRAYLSKVFQGSRRHRSVASRNWRRRRSLSVPG